MEKAATDNYSFRELRTNGFTHGELKRFFPETIRKANDRRRPHGLNRVLLENECD